MVGVLKGLINIHKVVWNGACGLSLQHVSFHHGYSRVLPRRMADRFAVFRDFHCRFILQIVKLLFSVKFFPYCGFPNILTNMVSPNSRIESKFSHFAIHFAVSPRPRLLSTFESLAAKHSFVSFQTRTNLSEFQLQGVF